MLVRMVAALCVYISLAVGWDIDCSTMDISSSVNPLPKDTFPHHLKCTKINDREIIAILTATAHFTGLMMQVHLNGSAVGTFYTRATPENPNAVGLNYEVGCLSREAQLSVDEVAKVGATAEWIMLDRTADLSGNLECVVTVIESENRRWVKFGTPALPNQGSDSSTANSPVTKIDTESRNNANARPTDQLPELPTVQVPETIEPTVEVPVHAQPIGAGVDGTEITENSPSFPETDTSAPFGEPTVTVLPATQAPRPSLSNRQPIPKNPPTVQNRQPVRNNPPILAGQPTPEAHSPGISNSQAHNSQASVNNHPTVHNSKPPTRNSKPPVHQNQSPVRNTQPAVHTSQPPIRNSQPPIRNNQPPVHNQSGSIKRGRIEVEGNAFPEHCMDRSNRLRVPVPNTGCGSYLTIENGHAKSLHGCRFGLCMDSSSCTCKTCNFDACPGRSVGTMSIAFYDDFGVEAGRLNITSTRRQGENSGYTTSTDITGITNPSNIPAADDEIQNVPGLRSQPDTANGSLGSRGSGLRFRNGGVLSRLQAMLSNF